MKCKYFRLRTKKEKSSGIVLYTGKKYQLFPVIVKIKNTNNIKSSNKLAEKEKN